MFREGLARKAVTEALRFRANAGHSLDVALCPFDLADALGIDVHFQAIPSLEGMYSPTGPTIIIGSMRPAGRRAFTCAHELGHHALGHGLSVDQLVEDQQSGKPKDDNEYAADRFASALLMPKLAVTKAFAMRGWSISDCTAEQAYVIAGVFGVGYTALVGYLDHTLHVVPAGDGARLARVRLGPIRKRLLGFEPPHGLVIVDAHWGARPVDLQVGDVLLLPPGSRTDGSSIAVDGTVRNQVLAQGVAPGVGTISIGSRTITTRVARPAFHGLAVYRHLEDVEDES